MTRACVATIWFIAAAAVTSVSGFAVTPSMSTNPFEGLFGGGKSKGGGSKQPFTVAITGSSGLVGTALRKDLEGAKISGRPVRTLRVVRRAARSEDEVQWNPLSGEVETAKLEGIDAFVHLAGEGVASGAGPTAPTGRWDFGKKEAIMDSRVKGTATIVSALQSLRKPPKALICSSAVGFYGYDSGDATFTEGSPKGGGFLADVCEKWEAEALKCKACRVICLRSGVVLAKNGGALAKLLPIFSLGAGGNLGSGNQYFSWVSLRDMVGIIKFAVERPTSLPQQVNACAPQPCTNADFTTALGKAIRRPVIFPVPEAVGGVVFGEMGKEMLFGGQRVEPTKLKSSGFSFEDSTIDEALGNIFS